MTCLLSDCAQLLWSYLFATLWTVALQAPLSMGFSRQDIEEGCPVPSSRLSDYMEMYFKLFQRF